MTELRSGRRDGQARRHEDAGAGSVQDDTDQTAVARVLDNLLARAGNGPSGRVAGRTAAAAAVTRLPGLPGTTEESPAAGEPEDAPVEPFGVFDPLGDDDSGLW